MPHPDTLNTDVPDRRRANSPASTWLIAELEAIKDEITSLKTKIDELDSDVRSGVPEGGFQRHLEFHRQVEEGKQLKKERWNTFVNELMTKGGWAAFLFVAYSIWEAIKGKVNS